MADEDELYYLQPGFDLNTLTVPRLRSILVAHNIHYPSSAKKSQLLEILGNELLPKREKLLRAQARVRRTSKGITDVPSSQESTISSDEGDDRQLMPPPPAPRTPRSRKSKSDLAAEESVGRAPSTSKRTKTPSRRSVTRTPRASDTEHTEPEEAKSTVRRPRKSAPTQPVLEPAVKIEEPDARLKRESLEAGTSPFSDENPFQSGSSPPSASDRRKSASRSRKSLSSTTTTKRGQTSSTSLKPEDSPPSRSTVSFPISRVMSADTEDGVTTTEEFTPDAARELAEDEQNGQLVPGRTSTLVRRKKKKPTGPIAKTAPLAILTSVLGALGAWYRQEKINVGYCGVGEPNWSLASNPHIPAWVHENFQPSCEPCPQHAVCYPNMEVECETDFVLKPHPLSLNGGVPLPPTCEPDSEKQRRIKAVADRAIEELRERRAAYECGEEVTAPSNAVARETQAAKAVAKPTKSQLEITEEDLKQTVSKMKRRGMTDEEFEDLWRGALGDILGRDEVQVTQDRSGRQLVSSSSLARLPFTCAIRRSVLRAIAENRIPIAILILLVSGLAYGRNQIITHKQNTARIPGLVATTLDRLATQASLNQEGRVSEPFISIGQLRDDVLRSVFSASERERVWRSVRRIVEGNSNVRAGNREGGKTGEVSRVWEWIGPVDLAPGLEGRRSGGLITDGRAGGSSSPGEDGVVKAEDRSNMETRRWDEGRAIY
ncbi:sister chromatid separation protein [Cladophialophora carrionii]|uniref:Sister chromatid separation protein n=1 Tax=Cladophialophora carrionii TaxID=86049 RepID=A0A1C1CYH0_9EURO|nr:sister chromatid separation protein [Cladophialophora carrionii]